MEVSLDHWNVGFGVLWGFMSGTSCLAVLIRLCCSTNKICLPPPPPKTQGWRVCPGNRCQMDSPPGSWVGPRNCPWTALPDSASSPAAGNWIWVLWSQGVVKAAGVPNWLGCGPSLLWMNHSCREWSEHCLPKVAVGGCGSGPAGLGSLMGRFCCTDHGWVLCSLEFIKMVAKCGKTSTENQPTLYLWWLS